MVQQCESFVIFTELPERSQNNIAKIGGIIAPERGCWRRHFIGYPCFANVGTSSDICDLTSIIAPSVFFVLVGRRRLLRRGHWLNALAQFETPLVLCLFVIAWPLGYCKLAITTVTLINTLMSNVARSSAWQKH